MGQDDLARRRSTRSVALWLGFWLAIAAMFVGGVLASDDAPPPARAAAGGDALKLTQVTIDKTGIPAGWTVSASSATWDTEGWHGDYSWSIPANIPPAGADASLSVTSTDKNGGRINGWLHLECNIPVEGGPADVAALADKNGGEPTKTATKGFKLVPGSYCDACPITATVAIQDGPRITFSYKVVPKPAPCAGVSRLARAADKDCATKTVTEPRPGGTATISSPTLAPGASKLGITVSSSSGNLKGTTIVGEGESGHNDRTGEAVAACWLIGPDALNYGNPKVRESFLRTFKETFEHASPRNALLLCVLLVQELAERLDHQQPDARSAARSCQAQRLGIAMRIRRGRIVSARPLTSQRVPRTGVRYKCVAGADGRIKLSVDGRRRGGLRKKLGRKLNLGIARAPHASPARGKLTFGFGPP
jgi:hypothetical protein